MLVLLTLVAAVLAWKYNQRNRILAATKQIQDLGGQVFYRTQNPTTAVKVVHFQSPYRLRPETKTRSLPDGTVENYEVFGHRSFNHIFSLQIKSIVPNGKVNQKVNRFLVNAEILVGAVKVQENDVDAEFVKQLQQLDDLKIVLVCRDREYFRVYGANPNTYMVTTQQRADRLSELGKPYEDAKSLIHDSLPNVEVVDGLRD